MLGFQYICAFIFFNGVVKHFKFSFKGFASFGSFGEALAQHFLESKGYRLLSKNFHVAGGEIDLIMEAPVPGSGTSVTVFVEVKTRRSNKFGPAEDSITASKLYRLMRAAMMWRLKNFTLKPWRIDVIAINFRSAHTAEISHYQNVEL